MQPARAFSIDIPIRFRDLDALGHVNNAVFFTYFEHGRVRFFQEHAQISDPTGFGFILAHISCDYLKPVRMTDRLRLQMRVGTVKSKSFTFDYRLCDRDSEAVVYATGESVQVCYDYSRNRSVPVPPELKARLLSFRPSSV